MHATDCGLKYCGKCTSLSGARHGFLSVCTLFSATVAIVVGESCHQDAGYAHDLETKVQPRLATLNLACHGASQDVMQTSTQCCIDAVMAIVVASAWLVLIVYILRLYGKYWGVQKACSMVLSMSSICCLAMPSWCAWAITALAIALLTAWQSVTCGKSRPVSW